MTDGKPRTRYYSSEEIQVGLCLNNEAVMYSLLYALDSMGTGNMDDEWRTSGEGSQEPVG